MTEREGDLEDCINLAKKGLDWDIILHELKGQVKDSKKDVWITWIGERLDLLEDRGLAISIKKDIDKMTLAYYEALEKRIDF